MLNVAFWGRPLNVPPTASAPSFSAITKIWPSDGVKPSETLRLTEPPIADRPVDHHLVVPNARQRAVELDHVGELLPKTRPAVVSFPGTPPKPAPGDTWLEKNPVVVTAPTVPLPLSTAKPLGPTCTLVCGWLPSTCARPLTVVGAV